MNRFKIRSFFAEFSFLSGIQLGVNNFCFSDGKCTKKNCVDHSLWHNHPAFICKDHVEEVKVSRISPEFLQTRAWHNGATGSLVDINESERIFLLGKEGNVIIEIAQSREVVHNEAHTDNEFDERETVGETLLRLENPDDVVYAVSVRTGYEIRDHHSVGGNFITLYKAPRGFTLKGWVEEQERRASEQLAATIVEIDAEA